MTENKGWYNEYEEAFDYYVDKMIPNDLKWKMRVLTNMGLYKNNPGRFGVDAATRMVVNVAPLAWWDTFSPPSISGFEENFYKSPWVMLLGFKLQKELEYFCTCMLFASLITHFSYDVLKF